MHESTTRRERQGERKKYPRAQPLEQKNRARDFLDDYYYIRESSDAIVAISKVHSPLLSFQRSRVRYDVTHAAGIRWKLHSDVGRTLMLGEILLDGILLGIASRFDSI